MKVDRCVLLALILCAIILLGEFCTVSTNIHTFDSNAKWNETEGYVDYSVSTNGSEVYSAILTDNGTYKSTETLKIYAGDYTDKSVIEKKQIYIDITESLKKRGFTDVSPCNDESLDSFLKESKGDRGFGLLVIAGYLPVNVYDASASNALLDWIKAGGNLYWYGSMAGRYFMEDGMLMEVPNYQTNLFGTEDCINTGITNANKKIDNGFTDLYSLKNSQINNGLNYEKIRQTGNVLAMGYQIDGYATITMVENGSGMVCVFSNSFATYGIDDIAQVIAGRINVHTKIISHQDGQVSRGTVDGRINYQPETGHNYRLYIYLGGTYTVYGRSF